MDLNTLLLATALALAVFSIAYSGAFHNLRGETYWRTWTAANVFLALTLGSRYLFPAAAHLANQLLISAFATMGFALLRQGALEFNGKKVSYRWLAWPFGTLLLASLASLVLDNRMIVSGALNLILAVLALTTALEYNRQNARPLSSRAGLVFGYALLTLDLCMLALQHVFMASLQPETPAIPYSMHAVLWLTFAISNGSFSMAIAFERKLYEEREAAIRDPLTGAYNRREMMARLDQLLATPNRPQFAFILLDLDYFKSINDRFGHSAGDEVLRNCVDLIGWHLRPKDCLARLGGEEFAILLPNISVREAKTLAETIRSGIETHSLHVEGHDIKATVSIGLFIGHEGEMSPQQIVRAADRELYRSKDLGRNRVSTTRAA